MSTSSSSGTISLIAVAAILVAAWWVLGGTGSVDPVIPGAGTNHVVARFAADLATIHRSAARRLRSGEISSEGDLKRYIAFAQKASRPRWSIELGQSQGAISGSKWTRDAAASLCDRLAGQFEQ